MTQDERAIIAQTKADYPPGTRLELINMNDAFAPVSAGTRGTVTIVDDAGTIHMRWDNGRSLGVIPGEDSFRKLTPQELVEEQNAPIQEGGEMGCQTM